MCQCPSVIGDIKWRRLLVKYIVVFLSQMTLLRWVTFLHRLQTVILTVLFFWISFFLLMLVFVLQWLSRHWEIWMMLSQLPLTFCQTQNWEPHFIAQLMTILVLIVTVFVIISEMLRKTHKFYDTTNFISINILFQLSSYIAHCQEC